MRRFLSNYFDLLLDSVVTTWLLMQTLMTARRRRVKMAGRVSIMSATTRARVQPASLEPTVATVSVSKSLLLAASASAINTIAEHYSNEGRGIDNQQRRRQYLFA